MTDSGNRRRDVPDPVQTAMRSSYTDEVGNLALFSREHARDLAPLTESVVEGDFFGLLQALGLSLFVSREYEHFVHLLGQLHGTPHESAIEIPHPSGAVYRAGRRELVVSSTRTPNHIIFMRLVDPAAAIDTVPPGFEPPDVPTFVAVRSIHLPGSYYIHDVATIGDDLVATITGHNYLARIGPLEGAQRIWSPRVLDPLGAEAFRVNCLQLNSIAVGRTLDDCLFTAFSDEVTGAKPWKAGYGPDGRGVVFSGATREVTHRGLTCPHSARLVDGRQFLCNSGYGQLCEVGTSGDRTTIVALNGFTRGLAIHGGVAFVGLSRVIDTYEAYAPGLRPQDTVCGVVACDLASGRELARITWPRGYQIYDVVALPGLPAAGFATRRSHEDINSLLRYLSASVT